MTRLPSLLCLALGLCCGATPAQESQPLVWKSQVLDVAIPLRDGRSLAADIHLPEAPGRYPAILVQTPYDKRRFAAAFPAADADQLFDREHYAWVVVDWRGFHASKEAMHGGFRNANRGQDGYDCVEWVAAQSFCDGKVGTYGGSALGHQQFATAAERPPHLVCCVPMIAPLGQAYERYYPGGVLLEGHVQTLDRLGFGLGKSVRQAPLASAVAWGLVRQANRKPADFDLPLLLITGWWDHYPQAILETFAALREHGGPRAREHTRLVIGPWDHMHLGVAEQGDLRFAGAAGAPVELARRFLARWLRGSDAAGWDREPPLRYWQAGEEGWRRADTWPPPCAAQTWYLHSDGVLDQTMPGARDAAHLLERAYRYDPREPVRTLGGANLPPLPGGPRRLDALAQRADVLAYTSGPLPAPLRLAGQARVALTFRVDRVDCDVVVLLAQVEEDGTAILLADGIRRAKLRDSTKMPSLLKPGQDYDLEVELPPLACTFAAGQRLRIYLASGNWPRYERNPHTGDDHWVAEKSLPLAITFRHDRDRPMRLVLPVLR